MTRAAAAQTKQFDWSLNMVQANPDTQPNRADKNPITGADMFRFSFGRQHRNCSGVSRRHALRLGTCGLIGGLTLPRLLELQVKAAGVRSARARSCIFLFLEGGPPHQDMWDPKPKAPPEIRGPFETINTNVTDVFVTDRCVHRWPTSTRSCATTAIAIMDILPDTIM